MNKGHKFDICLMNPPYLGDNRNDYNFPLKFLNKVCEISNRVISIQPIMFIFKTYDRKSPEFTEKTAIQNVETYKTSIDEVNMDEFDAKFGNKIGIIDINTQIEIGIFTVNNKEYQKVSEVTKFSHDKLLTKFAEICKTLSAENNIGQHMIYAADKRDIKGLDQKEKDNKSNKWFVNIAIVRGNKGTADMYSVIPKDRNAEYGNRPSSYINFNSKEEAENFINYVKTDFVSSCLYLYKYDLNLAPLLRYIPWFDFSDPHFSKSPKEIDDWLFKKYNISDEIRKHIEEILPDYYGIRK